MTIEGSPPFFICSLPSVIPSTIRFVLDLGPLRKSRMNPVSFVWECVGVWQELFDHIWRKLTKLLFWRNKNKDKIRWEMKLFYTFSLKWIVSVLYTFWRECTLLDAVLISCWVGNWIVITSSKMESIDQSWWVVWLVIPRGSIQLIQLDSLI